MKKIFYLSTAFVLCGGIAQANAACIATPSCTTLGYTSTTSCTDGLKCPFGNYWNCNLNKITELTNKITELEKKIEALETSKEICYIGSILYSDMTCSKELKSEKKPIGIVVYLDNTGGGQAIALNKVGETNYYWSTESGVVFGLSQYTSNSAASQDYASCKNSQIIMAAGDKSKYPAVWAAHEYSTEGTSAGDWCLPAAGIITSIYNNQNEISTGFVRTIGTPFPTTTQVWTSSAYTSSSAWYSNFNANNGLSADFWYYDYEVRPVIEF